MSDVRVGATNTLAAVSNWLSILSGNLTGSTVQGYRETRAEFGDILSQTIAGPAPATNNYAAIDPMQFSSSGAMIKGTITDFNQGNIRNTGRPTDLAINGDALFVLSKVPNPTSMNDLVFTRNGSFHFETQLTGAGGTTGSYRLVNQEGLFVMGVNGSFQKLQANVPGQTNPPPNEVSGSGLALPAGLQPITIPFDTNQATGFNQDFGPQFNASGQVFDPNTNEPFLAGPNNGNVQHLPMFVALMKFSNPEGLSKQSGSSEFNYNPQAGTYFGGVAQNPLSPGSPISHDNTIVPASVEDSNSSVNTTLPELTIAQKSFTANVKIIQVGNGLVDDVDQLIR